MYYYSGRCKLQTECGNEPEVYHRHKEPLPIGGPVSTTRGWRLCLYGQKRPSLPAEVRHFDMTASTG